MSERAFPLLDRLIVTEGLVQYNTNVHVAQAGSGLTLEQRIRQPLPRPPEILVRGCTPSDDRVPVWKVEASRGAANAGS